MSADNKRKKASSALVDSSSSRSKKKKGAAANDNKPRQPFQTIIECGIPTPGSDPSRQPEDGSNRIMTIDSDFFNQRVPVFTAEVDPTKRPLFKASDLAAKFNCANNMLAMYLNRRKRRKDTGIYQALGFRFKSVPRGSLKCGGYFISMEACKDFEQHFQREHGDSVITSPPKVKKAPAAPASSALPPPAPSSSSKLPKFSNAKTQALRLSVKDEPLPPKQSPLLPTPNYRPIAAETMLSLSTPTSHTQTALLPSPSNATASLMPAHSVSSPPPPPSSPPSDEKRRELDGKLDPSPYTSSSHPFQFQDTNAAFLSSLPLSASSLSSSNTVSSSFASPSVATLGINYLPHPGTNSDNNNSSNNMFDYMNFPNFSASMLNSPMSMNPLLPKFASPPLYSMTPIASPISPNVFPINSPPPMSSLQLPHAPLYTTGGFPYIYSFSSPPPTKEEYNRNLPSVSLPPAAELPYNQPDSLKQQYSVMICNPYGTNPSSSTNTSHNTSSSSAPIPVSSSHGASGDALLSSGHSNSSSDSPAISSRAPPSSGSSNTTEGRVNSPTPTRAYAIPGPPAGQFTTPNFYANPNNSITPGEYQAAMNASSGGYEGLNRFSTHFKFPTVASTAGHGPHDFSFMYLNHLKQRGVPIMMGASPSTASVDTTPGTTNHSTAPPDPLNLPQSVTVVQASAVNSE